MDMVQMWTCFGMIIATISFLQNIVPTSYLNNVSLTWKSWLHRWAPFSRFNIAEYDNCDANELYEDTHVYLSSLTATGAQSVNVTKLKNEKSISFCLANDQLITDIFEGYKMQWEHLTIERSNEVYNNDDSTSDTKRSFHLQVPRIAKDSLALRYMEFISKRAIDIRRNTCELKLYTNKKYPEDRKLWSAVPFLHPSTFDTIAFDPDLKSRILADLDEFKKAEEVYRRVGKVWKRGYLLYGPPGTGKSSMIAAIANKMRYDIYDLELTEVDSNSQLRKLLIGTSNKSIIVIEDIDCSLDLVGQRDGDTETSSPTKKRPPKGGEKNKTDPSRVTLSGLLNFVDGLWSSCGMERIFIFTTNHMEKLDEAMLRPGRMDMLINLGYCSFQALKILVQNYMQISDHHLYPTIEKLMASSFVTPAQITEILIKHYSDPDTGLEKVIQKLRSAPVPQNNKRQDSNPVKDPCDSQEND